MDIKKIIYSTVVVVVVVLHYTYQSPLFHTTVYLTTCRIDTLIQYET
jgi:hypothetical protein